MQANTQWICGFSKILALLMLPPETTDRLLHYARKNRGFLTAASEDAYQGAVPDFPICRHRPFTRLAVVCVKLMELQTKWMQHGLPEDVFRGTVTDVTLRQRIYQEKTGSIGLSRSDVIWFRHLFSLHIFRLGELQFQLFKMIYLDEEGCGEAYMTFSTAQKRLLPPDTPVLNIHIPAGADLSPAAVGQSLTLAGEFFPQYFPAHQARTFLCYSWLLYPGLRKLLPEGCNILRFAARFNIVSQLPDREEAMERIFSGCRRAKKDYPQSTALQRAALLHPENIGYACGIADIVQCLPANN